MLTMPLLQGLRAVYPAPGQQGAVELLPADLARLDPEEFLNDTIIDFWMRCGPAAAYEAGSALLGLPFKASLQGCHLAHHWQQLA